MADREQCVELAHQLRATFVVSREIARGMPAETPLTAVMVLGALDRHGELRMSRLAELLDVDMSVTSRHVAFGVERGWIDRAPDPLDRRSRLLRLTEHGTRTLRSSSDRAAAVVADHLADWPDADVARLSELLARLRDSFGDCRTATARRGAHHITRAQTG
ncbi:MarR family winged helix-turn-helix transcriptional regulator [Streptomyces sp. CBMA29]|uniref:MarR family winged helix-turn-helix transcriptional regulator n=1 Tax=Streptomyces sp. CBMA29 TaxID=1896314 RepID=UPI00166192E0|nr:MarR family winged helix-turn-helix transcriptional regulator [Streptomyces sp. CBMA29]MBD0739038.1 MarR family transcriptional regulator [Streptomyces sp. CBMA29]